MKSSDVVDTTRRVEERLNRAATLDDVAAAERERAEALLLACEFFRRLSRNGLPPVPNVAGLEELDWHGAVDWTPDHWREFLEQEERLLIDVGLGRGLVNFMLSEFWLEFAIQSRKPTASREIKRLVQEMQLRTCALAREEAGRLSSPKYPQAMMRAVGGLAVVVVNRLSVETLGLDLAHASSGFGGSIFEKGSRGLRQIFSRPRRRRE